MSAVSTVSRSAALAWPLLAGGLVGVAVAWSPLGAVALVVGLGVLWLGVREPVALVGLLFVAMLFDRAGVTGVDVDEFPVTASKLGVVGSLAAWTLQSGSRGRWPLRWHPALGGLLVLVGSTALCIALANALRAGKFTLVGLGMMAVMVSLVYSILVERPLRQLYHFVAACLVLAMAYAVTSPGGGGEAGRATGTMGDPNEWAAIVLLVSPVVIGGLAHDRGWSAAILRLSVLLLAPMAVLRSESRSALVVGLLVLPGWLYLLRARRGELLAAGAIGVVAVPVLVDLDDALSRTRVLVARLQGEPGPSDASLEERGELFRQGWQLFSDHWLVGAGPGNFARATGFISHSGTLRPAHNTYLEIAGEQGVLGLAAAAVFGLTVVRTLWRGAREAPGEPQRAPVLGAALGLGAVALMAGTLGLLTFAMAYLVLGIALAVADQARPGAATARPSLGGR